MPARLPGRRFGLDDVRAALNRVIDKHPADHDEHIASGHIPRYLIHGRPCCLVAIVLTELGCTTGVLRALDREATDDDTGEKGPITLHLSRHPYLRRFTTEARELLNSLQRQQDGGRSWRNIAGPHLTSPSPDQPVHYR